MTQKLAYPNPDKIHTIVRNSIAEIPSPNFLKETIGKLSQVTTVSERTHTLVHNYLIWYQRMLGAENAHGRHTAETLQETLKQRIGQFLYKK